MKNLLFIGFLLAATLCSCSKSSDPTPTPVATTLFPQVKTIVQNNCLTCHLSTGTWAGRPTKFDTDDQISALASSIKAAVSDPVTITNKRMPQGGTLSQADINTIIAWFNKGGKTTD